MAANVLGTITTKGLITATATSGQAVISRKIRELYAYCTHASQTATVELHFAETAAAALTESQADAVTAAEDGSVFLPAAAAGGPILIFKSSRPSYVVAECLGSGAGTGVQFIGFE